MGTEYTDSVLDQALDVLRQGGVVAFPTETVYGLGASLYSDQGIARIFSLKGRPQDNPLIAHVGDIRQIEEIATHLSDSFYRLAEVFFPGPLTLLVTKKEGISARASAGLLTLGVRMPNHPIALALCQGLGHPIVAPSANLSGRPSSTLREHVVADFGTEILVLHGECGIGLESTIVSLDPHPCILRPGAISAEQIAEVLGVPVSYQKASSIHPICPGMKYRHYAPKAQVLFTPTPPPLQAGERSIVPMARSLYADLRQADADGMQRIYLIETSAVRTDLALMNRIEKILSDA